MDSCMCICENLYYTLHIHKSLTNTHKAHMESKVRMNLLQPLYSHMGVKSTLPKQIFSHHLKFDQYVYREFCVDCFHSFTH